MEANNWELNAAYIINYIKGDNPFKAKCLEITTTTILLSLEGCEHPRRYLKKTFPEVYVILEKL